MENLGNDFQTILSAGINAAVTAITVVSGTGAPAANFRVRVDDELMLVTDKGAGTNWTVTRAIEGTAAAVHAANATVTHVLTAGGIAQKISEAITSDGALLIANNLADVQSASAARANLGLGSAALLAASAVLLVANNLSDVANAASSATSLGLGAASNVTHASLTVTGQLTSQVATGTAPLVVTSTTQVANLNASQLIGATWAAPGAIGATTPSTGAFTTAALGAGAVGGPSVTFSDATTGFFRPAANAIGVAISGVDRIRFNDVAAMFTVAGSLGARDGIVGMTAGIGTGATHALSFGDGSDIIAQRRGTAAQAYRLYETFTDVSNYSRLEITSGTTFDFIAKAAGTGTLRELRFGSSAAQWRMTGSAHLLAVTDNVSDIGAAGATRPRNIFVAGGMCIKVKAGAPVDGDFTNPTDGMIVGDSTNVKFWIRLGGAWKGVVVA